MGFDVKITTFPHMLDLLLPYDCRGCGRIGEPLCGCCKKYIVGNSMQLSAGDLPVFAAGRREGVLKKLVVEYKYNSRRGFARTLVEILAGAVPSSVAKRLVAEEAVVVPLPTISKHIRSRGFDHTAKMAKELAKMTGLEYAPLLRRANKTVQVGADEETRKKQATSAYESNERFFATRRSGPSPRADRAGTRAAALRIPQKDLSLLSRPVLLVDDIWTTGASMRAAAEKLREVGFTEVYGVVVACGLGATKKASEEAEKSQT